MRVFRCAALIGLGLAVAGCEFATADYGGTHFACEEPPHTCPDGYACENGDCLPVSGQTDSGAQADAAHPLDEPDASSALPADASPFPQPDAARPDAGPPVVLTFGEGAADVQGVTTDTWLTDDHPDWTYGDSHRIAIDNDPNEIGLIRFDVTEIPTDALVVAAELDLVVREVLESGDAVAFALDEPWDAETATWNERAEGVPWSAPGAGTASQSSGVVAIFTPRNLGDYTVGLNTATVQTWVAEPQQNYGIAWFSTSPEGNGVELYSSDEVLSSLRPLLRVTYR